MKNACYLEKFHIDFKRNKINDGSREWQVEPKVMAVLVCLMKRPGEVFSKESLLQEVWPNTAIGSEVLTRAVSELRKIFGDEAKQPKFIETIYKKGYRLMITPDIPLEVVQKPESHSDVISMPQPRSVRWRRLAIAKYAIAVSILLIFSWFWWFSKASSSKSPLHQLQVARPLPVTSLSGHEFRSPVSPDGHRIAFVWEGLEPGDSYNLYLKTIDEEGVVKFTQSDMDVDYPAWSPDGKYLAYTQGCKGKSFLMMKPVIGGEARELMEIVGNFTGLDWSPNGKWLAYGASQTPSGPSQVFLFSLETHETRQLTVPGPGNGGDTQPAWKRDGLGIAFVRRWHVGDGHDLFWVPLNQAAMAMGEPKQITFDRLPISGITWLPEEQGLIMINLRDGYSRLCHIKLDDQIVQSLPVTHGFLMAPYVDSDGGRLTYTQKKAEQNIWTKPMNANVEDPGRRIVFSTHPDVSPVLSPDGEKLAWISMRSGYREVWVGKADGSQPRQVSRFEKGHIAAPEWDLQGKSILVTYSHQGNSDICRVPLNGGQVEYLTSMPGKESLGFISQDGEWLYFSSNHQDGWQIWRKHLQNKQLEQVTQHGGYAAAQASNGSLLYTKFGLYGLWKMEPDGGEILVVERFSPRNYGHWQLRDNHLYFLSWNGDYHELYRQDLASGDRQLMTGIGRLGWESHGFTLSPDCSQLVFGQCDSMESDIMMVELAQN